MTVEWTAGVVAALAGTVLGAVGPQVVGRLPEPDPDPDDDPAEAARHPAKVAYADLAARPGLARRLALWAGAVCGVAGLALGWSAALPAYILAGAVGVWLAWVDLRVHLLPDRLTGPLFVGCLGLLGVAALAGGAWRDLIRALLGAVLLLAFYLLLALIRPSDMGLGDVKLAAVLGLLLGWLGWGALVVGAVLGFLLGGLGGLAVVAAGRGGLRTAIPFGPFMLAGALLGVMWGEQVAAAYVGAL